MASFFWNDTFTLGAESSVEVGKGSSLRSSWLAFHSMKPSSHKMEKRLSGPQYSQYAAPKGEPSLHDEGWIEEESSHLSTALGRDFASALVSWGQDENH